MATVTNDVQNYINEQIQQIYANSLQGLQSSALASSAGSISSISATPQNPAPKINYNTLGAETGIKIATSNLLVDQTPLQVSQISGLLFQDFPATELMTNTSNFSLINGGSNNDTISNIKSISDEISSYVYSRLPNLNQINDLSLSYFQPSSGSGTNGATVYFNNNNIVIEVQNIDNNEFVEYQVVSQGTILDATI
jgi:hypothetical protein